MNFLMVVGTESVVAFSFGANLLMALQAFRCEACMDSFPCPRVIMLLPRLLYEVQPIRRHGARPIVVASEAVVGPIK